MERLTTTVHDSAVRTFGTAEPSTELRGRLPADAAALLPCWQ